MVKTGYKQTEIGILPDAWDTITFENCFTILPNNTLSRAELNYNSGEVQNIHYGDILVKFPAVLDCSAEGLPYINAENTTKDSEGFLRDGDLIVADTAEDVIVGKSTEVIGIGERKIVSGLHTIPCRPKDAEMFAPGWLGYFINHSTYHDQLVPYITGIKVSSISKSAISGTVIAVPKKEEQTEITAALSDIDALIANLEKLIAKKKDIKQGAMQELLTGKRRLPGFEGEWVGIEIGQNGYLLRESINPQEHTSTLFCEYSMPAFDDRRTPVKTYGSDMHSNRTVIYGTVLLFNKLNVRQKRIWLVNAIESNSVCSSEFLAYCSDTLDLRLMAQLLSTEKITNDFIGMSTGTSNSQKRITPNNFLEYSVYVPKDINEQSAIADILGDMDSGIAALEEKISKVKLLKSGMMSELLTGRIRLL